MRPLGHACQQPDQGERQDHGHAPGQDRKDPALIAARVSPQHHRQAAGDQDAQHHRPFTRAGDPRALMVVCGKLSAPGGIGQDHQGPGEIGKRGPAEQIPGADPGRRDEQEPGRHDQKGCGQDQPGPAPAEAGRKAVAQLADQRIAEGVQQPGHEQHRSDRGQAQAHALGVEGRQIEVERQIEGGERQAERAVGEQLAGAEGCILARRHALAGLDRDLAHIGEANPKAGLAISQVIAP